MYHIDNTNSKKNKDDDNKRSTMVQSQSLVNLKNERANLLQEYMQAKKRSNHRNIQTL